MLNSSYVISSPSDCQNPEAFNKPMIEGNILVCGYSYNFAYGAASVVHMWFVCGASYVMPMVCLVLCLWVLCVAAR